MGKKNVYIENKLLKFVIYVDIDYVHDVDVWIGRESEPMKIMRNEKMCWNNSKVIKHLEHFKIHLTLTFLSLHTIELNYSYFSKVLNTAVLTENSKSFWS